MSEIQPALTAEEWANGCTEKGYTFTRVGVDVWFGPPSNTDPLVLVQNLHAMAVVYLLDQPFGFTREDVEELRGRGDEADVGMDPRKELGWGKLHSLADRIEALLPPEKD